MKSLPLTGLATLLLIESHVTGKGKNTMKDIFLKDKGTKIREDDDDLVLFIQGDKVVSNFNERSIK